MPFFPVIAVIFIVLDCSTKAQSSDLNLIASRRQYDLSQFPTPADVSSISTWLSSQTDNGTWNDVNYATGCNAQRANWPIQNHWIRLITFAAAWSGLNPTIPSNWTGDKALLEGATKGLDYWFENDYTSDDCIGGGGVATETCPCGTSGLWNTNWFDQVILIPQLCSTTCLLLNSANLTDTQRAGCQRIPQRAYDRRDDYVQGLGYLTGANAINVMQNSVSLALYTNNSTMLADALDRAMAVVTFSDQPIEDGIHRDGSFLQHNGILYNGNYGKDLINAFIQLEGEAIGTSFAANDDTRQAFATDIKGSEYMIFLDQQTKQEHWDINVLGRFIAFPTQDLQASADINFNVTGLAAATADFEGDDDLTDTIRRLESNGTDVLQGNKGFWASDYMVHRRKSFVLGTKMISNRSHNTEYTNSANPYGYHLGQGTLFSYVTGFEYRDIMDAWDWNLIPGTTTLLDSPALSSSYVGVTGLKNWVGVVSDGWVGTAVEDYEDPHDYRLSYKKAWFFLEDGVVVTTSAVTVNSSLPTDGSSTVITVLDNRMAAEGGIYVDGLAVDASQGTAVQGRTLFYGGNGYLSYDRPFSLTLFEGNRTGNWSAISTSTAENTTIPIFSAYTVVPLNGSYSYAFFPASYEERMEGQFRAPINRPFEVDGVMGVAGADRLSLVFWPGAATSISTDLSTIGWSPFGSLEVASSQAGAFLFSVSYELGRTRTLMLSISDPSQLLQTFSFNLTSSAMSMDCVESVGDDGCVAIKNGVKFELDLPGGGLAGSTISRNITLQRW